MNRTEQAYAEILATQLAAGSVVAWWFEAVTLVVAQPGHASRSSWTPDFLVQLADGVLELVDVKGGRGDQEAQRVKAKLASERYPCFRFVVARHDRRHGWSRELI